QTCRAPLCPLDPLWEKRKHLQGEPVCRWLREVVKHGAEATFYAAGRGDIYHHVSAVMPIIAAKVGDIGRKLLRSACQGPKKVPTACVSLVPSRDGVATASSRTPARL